ncbi:SlyX family protein [Treponema zuelzerae]|uniref:SlyX family protein n=1 Tax=Teretinema zuelzerae TaxID=156 RepID=A0AAE3EIV7_9SPIR|nr:SlyX family protein [Teretinema zuelzerae]MCD1655820.1 SlyX family protein [Teretinema zuelzerae]
MTESDDRLVTIEMKLAYLEDFLGRLQETVLQQNDDLDKIKNENKALRTKLTDLSDTMQDMPHVRPPHY